MDDDKERRSGISQPGSQDAASHAQLRGAPNSAPQAHLHPRISMLSMPMNVACSMQTGIQSQPRMSQRQSISAARIPLG